MLARAERRLFPRREFRAGVYAYVDGRRYDARSENISAGGMLLATAEDIPLGHTIALVFKSRSGKKTSGEKGVKCGAGVKGEPVHLVGRVMRKQVSPVPGVGLRRVRAMTDAQPEARLKREHGWSFGELQDTIGDANTSHLMDAALSSKTLKSKALDLSLEPVN